MSKCGAVLARGQGRRVAWNLPGPTYGAHAGGGAAPKPPAEPPGVPGRGGGGKGSALAVGCRSTRGSPNTRRPAQGWAQAGGETEAQRLVQGQARARESSCQGTPGGGGLTAAEGAWGVFLCSPKPLAAALVGLGGNGGPQCPSRSPRAPWPPRAEELGVGAASRRLPEETGQEGPGRGPAAPGHDPRHRGQRRVGGHGRGVQLWEPPWGLR